VGNPPNSMITMIFDTQ